MTRTEALRNYYFSLPAPERRAKLRDLMELGELSYPVVYNMIAGNKHIDVAWRDKINEIWGVDLFKDCEPYPEYQRKNTSKKH